MWKSCQGPNVPSKEKYTCRGSEMETADTFGEQQVLQFIRERGAVDGEASEMRPEAGQAKTLQT